MKLCLSLSILLCMVCNVHAQKKKTQVKARSPKTHIQVDAQPGLGKELAPVYYKRERISSIEKGYLKTITCLETSKYGSILTIEQEEHPNTIEQEKELLNMRKPIISYRIPGMMYRGKITHKDKDIYVFKSDDGGITETFGKKYDEYAKGEYGLEKSAYLEDQGEDHSRWEQCNRCDGNTSVTIPQN